MLRGEIGHEVARGSGDEGQTGQRTRSADAQALREATREPTRPPPSPRASSMDEVLYTATRLADVVWIPPRTVLVLERRTNAAGGRLAYDARALCAIAHAAGDARRARGERWTFGPLEARWRPSTHGAQGQPPLWQLRVSVPDDVQESEVSAAVDAVLGATRDRDAAAADVAQRIRLERLDQTAAGRVLHVGPHERETESVDRVRRALAGAGLDGAGGYVAVHLNDATRAPVTQLETVLLVETGGRERDEAAGAGASLRRGIG
ncbi:MAG TPA: hypothetical protein VE987_18130 [Polyangiaceae bacterium]|nr:hypothetical protein [Polyangiaceae bacterium]